MPILVDYSPVDAALSLAQSAGQGLARQHDVDTNFRLAAEARAQAGLDASLMRQQDDLDFRRQSLADQNVRAQQEIAARAAQQEADRIAAERRSRIAADTGLEREKEHQRGLTARTDMISSRNRDIEASKERAASERERDRYRLRKEEDEAQRSAIAKDRQDALEAIRNDPNLTDEQKRQATLDIRRKQGGATAASKPAPPGAHKLPIGGEIAQAAAAALNRGDFESLRGLYSTRPTMIDPKPGRLDKKWEVVKSIAYDWMTSAASPEELVSIESGTHPGLKNFPDDERMVLIALAKKAIEHRGGAADDRRPGSGAVPGPGYESGALDPGAETAASMSDEQLMAIINGSVGR